MANAQEKTIQQQFKIGDLARLTNKTVRTLHFYEELEILRPSHRTKGGFRMYSPESVTRILLIEKLQLLGLSLPEIRDLLLNWKESETGSDAARTIGSLLVEKRTQLQDEISRLQHLEKELNATLNYLHHCTNDCSRETTPRQCPSCDHATKETRPRMISGLYPQ